MAAIGCLLPLLLLVAGAAVGGALGGMPDGIWGAAIGGALGLVAMLALWRWFAQARQDWPE